MDHKKLLSAAAIVALLAIAALFIRLTFWTLPEMRKDGAAALSAEAAKTRADLVKESAAWRQASDAQATAYRAVLERQLEAGRVQLAGELERVSVQAEKTLAAYAALPAQAVPVLGEASGAIRAARPLLEDSDRAVKMWTPQLNGLFAASKVFMGQGAQTMREIERATPRTITMFHDFLGQAQSTNVQITGIATDVHTWTTKMTAPQPAWKKALNVTVGIGTAALKGGIF